MSQDWFVYSFVARGSVILSEHTARDSNLPNIASQWLETLTSTPHRKFTTNYDNHTFNFLVENGYVYGVIAKESAGARILFEFLERVRDAFNNRYSHGNGDTSSDKNISKSFGHIMKEHMVYISDHAQEIDKLANVNAQISEVQVIIRDNIDKILERGEIVDSVADKARELHDLSQGYKNTTTEIKWKMWLQNMKVKLVILGILLLISALILWTSICHGFNCSK